MGLEDQVRAEQGNHLPARPGPGAGDILWEVETNNEEMMVQK